MATTMYMYDLITGELIGSRPAQVVGGKEITESSSATPVAPPAIPDGHAARWTGSSWEVVEDHRQYLDDNGTKQGGTPYWLPGDTHASPARYMDALGPLPDGAMLERPAPPPPTPEEIQAEFTRKIQERLDDFARSRGYDGILSACTYAASDVTKFADEGQYAVTVRDATWAKAYELLAGYETSGTIPDWADIETQLPALVWPEAAAA
jgi:hypothetical protein